jgi:hypothetical protein
LRCQTREYTQIVRALAEESDRAVLCELWRRGWLPDQRPSNGAAAACLIGRALALADS